MYLFRIHMTQLEKLFTSIEVINNTLHCNFYITLVFPQNNLLAFLIIKNEIGL